MKTHSILFKSSLFLATICFALGYLIAGYWQILPGLVFALIFWIVSNQRPAYWSSACSLLVYVMLAAVGIYLKLSTELMIAACTTSLAAWELIQFKQSTIKNAPAKINSGREKYHLHSLALATLTGLLLALTSAFINIRLPFGVVALLVLIAMVGLVFGLKQILKRFT